LDRYVSGDVNAVKSVIVMHPCNLACGVRNLADINMWTEAYVMSSDYGLGWTYMIAEERNTGEPKK